MIIKEKQVKGKDGTTIILRSLTEKDAKGLIDYQMDLAKESEYMVRYPEEVDQNIAEVAKRITGMIESETSAYIGAFVEDALVGNCGLYLVDAKKRMKHRCAIGLGIITQYRNLGIGRLLVQESIALAKTLGYEQVELDVVEENKGAIHVYESCGFEVTGRFPHAFKMKDGRYHDCLFMVKLL